MEDGCRSVVEKLPVGWRFHPYDEELLDFYLKRKLAGNSQATGDGFDLKVIELNKYDPRDLIGKLKDGCGEKEMYFFCPCEYYGSGQVRKRKNEGGGYWKWTGDPRPITLDGTEIGTKRSVVFHDPDATNFIITEYSYKPPHDLDSNSESPRDKFVICKLKVKPDRKKIIIKKSKQAETDSKNTRPKKKARKANMSDNNKKVEQTFTNSAFGEKVSANLHNEHSNKQTDTPSHEVTDEGVTMASFVDQTTVPASNQDETIEKQNAEYGNGKTGDLGKCVENQNECHKTDLDFKSSLKMESRRTILDVDFDIFMDYSIDQVEFRPMDLGTRNPTVKPNPSMSTPVDSDGPKISDIPQKTAHKSQKLRSPLIAINIPLPDNEICPLKEDCTSSEINPQPINDYGAAFNLPDWDQSNTIADLVASMVLQK